MRMRAENGGPCRHYDNVASDDTDNAGSLPGDKPLVCAGLAAVLPAAGSFYEACGGALAETLAPAGANAKYRADSSRARRKTTGMYVAGQTDVRRHGWHLATFAGILAGSRERKHACASQSLK